MFTTFCYGLADLHVLLESPEDVEQCHSNYGHIWPTGVFYAAHIIYIKKLNVKVNIDHLLGRGITMSNVTTAALVVLM
jgi:hypothetical protein